MAARPLASATISFGLVSIPVKLYPTVETAESISFRMLHKQCGSPLKYQSWCPKHEKAVERDDIVKGYEYAKDRFVLFTPEELKALEEEATKAIAIEEFVALGQVDPIYFDRAYYLGPEKGGERAYKLLTQAMQRKGLAGLARYAARGKQYLVLVRAVQDGLILQQLHYAKEVRALSEVPVPAKTEVKETELKLALQLIEQSISDAFHPEKYEDEVKGRVQEVIQQKIEGQEVTFAPAEAPKAQVIDLMQALKASLAAGGTGAAAAPKAAASTRKPAKTAAPRPAAAKKPRRRAASQ
jgi:DNA end-binding protein Ku